MKRSQALTYLLFLTLAGVWIAQAGNLDPPGPPSSTMLPLTTLISSWYKPIPLPSRFELVMNDEAVLDHETGLVWEKAPAGGYTPFWHDAVEHCYLRVTGDRFGWRLPTVEELATLIDPNAGASPYLPPGNPFVLPAFFPPEGVGFWTITTKALSTGGTQASWAVSFRTGTPYSQSKGDISLNAWCVRGGHGYDHAGQH